MSVQVSLSSMDISDLIKETKPNAQLNLPPSSSNANSGRPSGVRVATIDNYQVCLTALSVCGSVHAL